MPYFIRAGLPLKGETFEGYLLPCEIALVDAAVVSPPNTRDMRDRSGAYLRGAVSPVTAAFLPESRPLRFFAPFLGGATVFPGGLWGHRSSKYSEIPLAGAAAAQGLTGGIGMSQWKRGVAVALVAATRYCRRGSGLWSAIRRSWSNKTFCDSLPSESAASGPAGSDVGCWRECLWFAASVVRGRVTPRMAFVGEGCSCWTAWLDAISRGCQRLRGL